MVPPQKGGFLPLPALLHPQRSPAFSDPGSIGPCELMVLCLGQTWRESRATQTTLQSSRCFRGLGMGQAGSALLSLCYWEIPPSRRWDVSCQPRPQLAVPLWEESACYVSSLKVLKEPSHRNSPSQESQTRRKPRSLILSSAVRNSPGGGSPSPVPALHPATAQDAGLLPSTTWQGWTLAAGPSTLSCPETPPGSRGCAHHVQLLWPRLAGHVVPRLLGDRA